jgi:hypothetical protein
MYARLLRTKRSALKKGALIMPGNAFIIHPFGKKDVLLPGREEIVDGARVRVSKLMKVDFEEVHKKLIVPTLGRLHNRGQYDGGRG